MTEKRPESPSANDRKRLLILSMVVFAFFSILVAQFYHIQIIEGEKWKKIANKQHYFIVKDPFKRGRFISNTKIKKDQPEVSLSFVIDVQKFHLYADPKSIPESLKEDIAKRLIAILELPKEQETSMAEELKRKSRSRKLSMWLEKRTQDAVLEWWHPYAKKHKIPRNALFFISDYQRSYPFGSTLGQVLHTIQKVKNEKTLQALPTGGLELSCDKYLKGKQGKRRLMRSPKNALETGDILSLPEDGADIYLTINHHLQAIAEEELAKGVQFSKAKSGWAAMMDPYTGAILALAQFPFFDPADYQKYFNNTELIERTKVKAMTDANEPGSIMKPITLAVALKANEELKRRNEPPLFDPDAKMPTSNPNFSGRSKPLKDTHFHAFLNMDMAVQKSSNIYVARLVEKIVHVLGDNWYRQTLYEDFGIGRKTGIELPSESPGVLPSIGKKHPNGQLEWSKSTPYSMAMGHNIQVTSLQILRAYAIFANGGYLVQPTLIEKVVKTTPSGDTEVILDNHPSTAESRFKRVMSEENVRRITRAMKFTTKNGGTARRADVFGYTEFGKTGTADKVISGRYDPHYVCASFVGAVPAKKPAFVLIVTMDEPAYGFIPGLGRNHMGGTCSAPVFREISKRALEYLGISPDDPHGYPSNDPRFDKAKADWYPEMQTLQEMYEKWNH